MVFGRKFDILSLQFSIFTPALLFSANKILARLMSKFNSTFNGNTTVLPLPSDAPKEIPRLILPSSNEKIKLEISENRANFYRYRKEDDILIDECSFFKLCTDVYEEYIRLYTKYCGLVVSYLLIKPIRLYRHGSIQTRLCRAIYF